MISKEAFGRLDKTFATEAARFATHAEEELQKELGPVPEGTDAKAEAARKRRAEREQALKEARGSRRARSGLTGLIVTFDGGRRVEADTLEEIARMPELQDLVPIGLEVRLRSNHVECTLEIERDSGECREFCVRERRFDLKPGDRVWPMTR